MEEYKGYAIKPVNQLVGFEVEYIGRGSAHMSLRGFFTDKRTAKKFIDRYVDGKEEKDGKTNSSDRSKQIQRRINYRRKPTNNAG